MSNHTPNREMRTLGAVLDELLPTEASERGNTPFRALLLARHGQTPPLEAQWVWQMLHALPRSLAVDLTSEASRAAQRDLFAGGPVYLAPSRNALHRGLTWLATRDLLPDWTSFRGGER